MPLDLDAVSRPHPDACEEPVNGACRLICGSRGVPRFDLQEQATMLTLCFMAILLEPPCLRGRIPPLLWSRDPLRGGSFEQQHYLNFRERLRGDLGRAFKDLGGVLRMKVRSHSQPL